ncbi:MAG: hypothetical protein RLW62_06080 [Gammaproteobacteria bacterium]
MQLRALHRISAIVIAAYALFHVANHLVALHGVDAHIKVMETLRVVYRQPPIEVVLLTCAMFQAGSGLWLVIRGWRQRAGAVAWLQAISGVYIAFFLLVHVTAVLFGRAVLHLDTNFFFAAAGFHVHPYQWFFGPYYFLAVAALFAHIGCAAYWQLAGARPRRAAIMLNSALIVGVLCSALITLSLAGVFEPFTVPAEYTATYGGK